ncbi:hypothetical protein [Streptomyces sp. NBC_01589]|uniref:hypothetical protein n=1 Tax=unclassified Streptomyces TaxID=2593676 RepID=UPI003868CB2A
MCSRLRTSTPALRLHPLRPSFAIRVFTEHSAEICEVLDWFILTAALELARRA